MPKTPEKLETARLIIKFASHHIKKKVPLKLSFFSRALCSKGNLPIKKKNVHANRTILWCGIIYNLIQTLQKLSNSY